MPKRDTVWDCTTCGRTGNLAAVCAKCGREKGNAKEYDLLDFERTTGGTRVAGDDAPPEKPRAQIPAVRTARAAVPQPRARRSWPRKLALFVLLAALLAVLPYAARLGGTRGEGGPLLRFGKPPRGAWVMVVNKRVENGAYVARVRTSDHEIVDIEVERARWETLEKGQIRDATFSRFGGLASIGKLQK